MLDAEPEHLVLSRRKLVPQKFYRLTLVFTSLSCLSNLFYPMIAGGVSLFNFFKINHLPN